MTSLKTQKWASQCKSCKAIETVDEKNRSRYIPSIVILPSLPDRPCYSCRIKSNEKADI